MWLVTELTAAYFCGTVPYIKSMICECFNNRLLAGTVAWHPLPGTSDEVRPHGAVGSGEDVAGEQHPVRGSGDPPLPR